MEKEVLLKRCIKSTLAFTIFNNYDEDTPVKEEKDEEKDEEKITDKAKELMALIHDKFGCNEDDVLKLVAALSGEDLKPKETEKNDFELTYKMLCCVVPISNHGEHSYPLNYTIMIIDPRDGESMHDHGETGGELSLYKDDIRPATEEEIKTYVDTLFNKMQNNSNLYLMEYVEGRLNQ